MKKILLASCVAAISAGVNAELTPLSEYELHSVTGQAGVDIELDVGLTIGEIRYTDVEENGDGDGGSITISDLFVGGGEGRASLFGVSNPGNTANINNFLFKVDVAADGDLIIGGSPISGNGGVGIVDFLITTGEIAVEGTGPNPNRHVLIDSMSAYGGAAAFNMTVDSVTNNVNFQIRVGIDDLDIDMTSSFGISIENAKIYGFEYFERKEANQLGPTDYAAEFYIEMSKDDNGDGVNFDFTQGFGSANIIDVELPSIVVGDANIGAIALNNFDFSGMKVNVSGH